MCSLSDDNGTSPTENAGNSARLVSPDSGEKYKAVASLAIEGEDKLSKHLYTPVVVLSTSSNKADSPLHSNPDAEKRTVRVCEANLETETTSTLVISGEGTD